MTKILGLSAYYHDSAATIVVDGEIIAAAQEERFSRKNMIQLFRHKRYNIACKKQAAVLMI